MKRYLGFGFLVLAGVVAVVAISTFSKDESNLATISAKTATGTVEITSVSPTWGAIGTLVIVNGTGFTTSTNTILMGSGAIRNVQGTPTTISFNIPSNLEPACLPSCRKKSEAVRPGAYSIQIENVNGVSNAINFTLTEPSLTVTIESSTPPSATLPMGSLGNKLLTFRVSNMGIGPNEGVALDKINVFQKAEGAPTTKQSFENLKLSVPAANGTIVAVGIPHGLSQSTKDPGPGYYYSFALPQGVQVQPGNSVVFSVQGDVPAYASSGTTDNSFHTFSISTSKDADNDTPSETIQAHGTSSSRPATVTLNGVKGNAMRVLRTKLSVTATQVPPQVGRPRSPGDDLSILHFTADVAGPLALNTVRVTFSSQHGLSNAFVEDAGLYDPELGMIIRTGVREGSCEKPGSMCTKTINLGTGAGGSFVQSGSQKSFWLRVNDTLLPPPTFNVAYDVTAKIVGQNDVQYTDALQGGITVGLASSEVPILLNSVSFPVGG